MKSTIPNISAQEYFSSGKPVVKVTKNNNKNNKNKTNNNDIFGEQLQLGYDVFDPNYTGRLLTDTEYDDKWLDYYTNQNK
jgi:hypothetical protein